MTTDGLLVVDKPAGMTSHDVVARCRKIFAQKRVGHAGTLDPDATGVLLVGLGRATRLMQYMSGLPKTYTTEIVLGAATTTLDDSGEVTGTWDMSGVTLDAARQAAGQLTGDILQVPPMVSAVKVGGRRLHELARAGVEVERAPRPVTVHRFELSGPIAPGPVFGAEVECSSGTYIRVLAADLGQALGGGGHIRRLRRTAVGPFTLAGAVPLESAGPDHVLAPASALPWMPAVEVSEVKETAVRHGAVLPLEELGATGTGPWRVLTVKGDLLAVYEGHGAGRAKPKVVLDGAG
jgi:tRNA pseudouridine55 synthase